MSALPVPTTFALFALLSEQHGVATCAQARRLGVSRAVERRLLREGALVELLPGVLAAGGVQPSFLALAKAASLRPGVRAVSHGTAARLHKLAGFDSYDRLDVLGGKGSHLRLRPPVISHYSRLAVDAHVTPVGTVPATSVPLTLALLAPVAGTRAVADALDDALSRGFDPNAIRRVAAEWNTRGRAGPSQLLRLLH